MKQQEKTFSIDEQEPTTVREIVESNDNLTKDDIINLTMLKVGESCYIGIVGVKRIS